MKQKTQNQIRCFCGRKTLLGVYGLDENNKIYIHFKVHKQDRIFFEGIVTEGTIKLVCRDCLRWHKIRIVDRKATLDEIPAPAELVGNT